MVIDLAMQIKDEIKQLITDRAELQHRVDSLTAEVEAQRKRANDAERGALDGEWYVSRDRYEDDIAELIAERDQLSRDLEAEHALVCQFEHDNEQLREAIDAVENGQFYAMYRQACEERDELKRGHERERQQMQRVIDTQRESFRKMEFELAQAKGGSDDEG